MLTTDPKAINEHAGRIIKWLREVFQIDQSTLADKIATSQSSLSQLEAGKRRLTPEAMAKIAEAFKVEPAYLSTLTIPDSSVPDGPVRQKLRKLQQEIRKIVVKAAEEDNARREKARLKRLQQLVPSE